MTEPVDGDSLDLLRVKGVTKATFHANGKLASVEFGPEAPSATQHEDSTAQDDEVTAVPLSRTSGRLVPRAVPDRS